MAEVTWVKGTIDPPQSGEYYVTLEAKQDIVDPVTGKVYYNRGDVTIGIDCYYAKDRFWEQMAKTIRSGKWCVGRTFLNRIFRTVFATDLWSTSEPK